MFRDAKIVWRSGRDIRDLMIEYFSQRGRLPDAPDHNWRLVPARAVETLAANATRTLRRSRVCHCMRTHFAFRAARQGFIRRTGAISMASTLRLMWSRRIEHDRDHGAVYPYLPELPPCQP